MENEIPKHIIVTGDLEYANKLCEDWYELIWVHDNRKWDKLLFVLKRLTEKRVHKE